MDNQTTSLAAYTLPTAEEVAEGMARTGGGKYWNPKKDDPASFSHQFRPLPGVNGKRAFIKTFRHFWQIPNVGWFSLICPIALKIRGAKCLGHELMSDYAAGNPLDGETLRDMEAKDLILMNVLVRGHEDRGVLVHEAHWSFRSAYESALKQGINLFDPTATGRDLFYNRPEQKGGRYGYTAALNPSPLCAEPEDFNFYLDSAHDLNGEAQPLDYQAQVDAYQKRLDNPSEGAQKPAQRLPAQQAPRPTAPASRQLSGTSLQPQAPRSGYGGGSDIV